MLRNVYCPLISDVSGQFTGSILKGPTIPDCLTLAYETLETSVPNYRLTVRDIREQQRPHGKITVGRTRHETSYDG